MRARGRTDANQGIIVRALRQIGVRVVVISSRGDNCPDLVAAFRGRTVLIEVKNPSGRNRLSLGQKLWLEDWPGEAAIIRTPHEALKLFLGDLVSGV